MLEDLQIIVEYRMRFKILLNNLFGITLFFLSTTKISAIEHTPQNSSNPLSNSHNKTPCKRPYDQTVSHPYLIHATWMFNRGDGCEWQKTLEQFHSIGGKVVMQFGQHLEKLHLANNQLYLEGTNTNILNGCQDKKTSCVDQTLDDFNRVGIDTGRIVNWLTYTTDDLYTDAILCTGSSLDKKITVQKNNKQLVFWRIVLPHNKNQKPCDYSTGHFDVMFVKNNPNKFNEAHSLLSSADALNMDVYLGAPAFFPSEGQAWLVDKDMHWATMDWSRRVFLDYAEQYKQHPSFKGIYQTFEVALQPGWDGDEHIVYQQQVQLFRKSNPDKKYIISPYFMTNKDMYGYDISGTVEGYKLLARTGIDIIIPQDGRGTGKGAHYWEWQKNLPIKQVDSQLANFENVKTATTFDKQYHASSNELFSALKVANDDLKTQEGISVDIWANVEAFEEDKRDASFIGCNDSALSQTKKSRLDSAITFASSATSSIASFMYDPLFICKDRYGVSLLDQIKSDFDRPLITHVIQKSNQLGELLLKGHYLSKPGLRFNIKWEDQYGNNQMKTITLNKKNVLSNGSVLLNLDIFSPADNSYIHIEAIGNDGRSSHEIYSLHHTRALPVG
jgi:hypothetical protein